MTSPFIVRRHKVMYCKNYSCSKNSLCTKWFCRFELFSRPKDILCEKLCYGGRVVGYINPFKIRLLPNGKPNSPLNISECGINPFQIDLRPTSGPVTIIN